MSNGIEALRPSQSGAGPQGPPGGAGRGVALALAVPFWAAVGGLAWLLLG